MKIQADTGEFVNRKGVYPPLADADKIKFVQMYQFRQRRLRSEEERISENLSAVAAG